MDEPTIKPGQAMTIKMETGEVTEVRDGDYTFLPPPPDHCQLCGTRHGPRDAHDATSLFWATRFFQRHGRQGTWADACAHLPPETQATYREVLAGMGIRYTEPPAGVAPVSEPIDWQGRPL